ncbi:MAG: hypothetical protein JOY84_09390 [Curvibacter sp.]|nr:hypothetical protein [Curvibacter sp.]
MNSFAIDASGRPRDRATEVHGGPARIHAALSVHLEALLSQACALEAETRQLAHDLDQPLWLNEQEMLGHQSRELSSLRQVLVAYIGGQAHELPRAGLPRPGASLEERLQTLCESNLALLASLRDTVVLCGDLEDTALHALMKSWLQDADFRTWSLFEASRSHRLWG